jgi:hypothetical protein
MNQNVDKKDTQHLNSWMTFSDNIGNRQAATISLGAELEPGR